MPVALPSLAACLQTLAQGHFGTEAHNRVNELLGIPSAEVEEIGMWGTARQAALAASHSSLFASSDWSFFWCGFQVFYRRLAVPGKETGWAHGGAQLAAELRWDTTVWVWHVSGKTFLYKLTRQHPPEILGGHSKPPDRHQRYNQRSLCCQLALTHTRLRDFKHFCI